VIRAAPFWTSSGSTDTERAGLERAVHSPACPQKGTHALANHSAIPAEPTSIELLRTAFDEARELASAELALAKTEFAEASKAALTTVVAASAAAALGFVALVMLVIGGLLAVGASLAEALFAGGVLFLLAATGAIFAGIRLAPKEPMKRTRTRLQSDAGSLKGHLE
jgi:hypothetical protein